MQHLLSEVLSPKSIISRLSRQKFELYLSALAEISDTFWQARTLEEFFRRALKVVVEHRKNHAGHALQDEGADQNETNNEVSVSNDDEANNVQRTTPGLSEPSGSLFDTFDEDFVDTLSWPWDFSFDWMSTS